MLSDLVFPQSPPVFAEWQPVFLEPIVIKVETAEEASDKLLAIAV